MEEASVAVVAEPPAEQIQADSLEENIPEELSPVSINSTVYFIKNSVEMTNRGEMSGLVDQAKKELKERQSEVVITGHTCDLGTKAYNEQLGMDRAKAVGEYLQKAGLSNATMNYRSKGEESPAVPNTTDANRVQNRRAAITIKSKEE